MKTTQQEIARELNVSQPFINRIFKKKDPISWPLAEKLSELFPGKTMQQWKKATPEELRAAFAQLKPQKETAA